MIFNVNIKKIRDFEKREYLLTLGNGSYCLNNILSIPSRRYHSLYNYSENPPVDRSSYINHVEETVSINGKYYNIFSRRIDRDKIFPEGHRYIRKIIVRKDEIVWFYKIEDIILKKHIFSENGILKINYSIKNRKRHIVFLFVRPYFESRKSDSLDKKEPNPEITGEFIKNEKLLFMPDKNVIFEKDYYKSEYFLLEEYNYQMDSNSLNLYSPGYYYGNISEYDSFSFVIRPELKRDIRIIQYDIRIHNHPVRNLLDFSSSFIVNSDEAFHIIAGYPWFSPWGRDTFISLPGLLIYTGLFDIADNILSNFSAHIKDGIIPNLISEQGDFLYNTVDASLWFINSVYELYSVSNDIKYIRKYYDIILSIIFNYRKGTINNIFMDTEDYLIYAGNPDTQLTWMDARRNNKAFTPRHGKAIEINALWYNALKIFELFSKKNDFSQNTVKAFELSEKIKENIIKEFYDEKTGYLADCINDKKDMSLRPNQLFAISLPFPVITDKEKQKRIVDICRKKLFTECGIRTLSPDHPDYRSQYKGNWFERDSCYHQGTAWPYLMGTFYESYLKAYDFSSEVKEEIRNLLLNFIRDNHTKRGIGFIPEIFDGSQPQNAHGTPMQAWSSAELIRIWLKYYN